MNQDLKVNKMIKIVVRDNLPFGRKVQKITDSLGQVSYKVKQGNQYIGKTTNGGYTSLLAAVDAATRLR